MRDFYFIDNFMVSTRRVPFWGNNNITKIASSLAMTLVFDSFGVLNVIEILDILLYCGDKGSFIQNDPQKDEAD